VEIKPRGGAMLAIKPEEAAAKVLELIEQLMPPTH
jgi:hypothetical protein